MIARAAALALAVTVAAPAKASEFRQVTNPQEFVSLIAGKALTRFGIRLEVAPDGRIAGSAFGRQVVGQWNWNGSYFCREMQAGSTEIPANCQAVLVSGDTVRFISDQGQGEYADLRLR